MTWYHVYFKDCVKDGKAEGFSWMMLITESVEESERIASEVTGNTTTPANFVAFDHPLPFLEEE